jgi:hypothetical protein
MSLLWIEETRQEESRLELEREEYVRFFDLQMSKWSEGSLAIEKALPSIARGAQHPDQPRAIVTQFEPTRAEQSCVWNLRVTYSTSGQKAENPFQGPPQISVETVERSEVRFVDAKNRPVVNAAGDLLDAQEVVVSDLVFKVQVNVSTKYPAYLEDYVNAINSDAQRIKGINCDVGTLQAMHFNIGVDDNQAGKDFAPMTFELHRRKSGWTRYIPNRGWFQLVPIRWVISNENTLSKRQLQKLLRSSGIKPSDLKTKYIREEILCGIPPDKPKEPQFLDKQGAHIANPTLKNIVLLPFDFQDALPFSQLPLK